MVAYQYSNTAVQTTLGGNITGAATSFTVAATTGFPASTPYVLALDYGAATEELVVVTGVAGTTLTVTRGFSGTSAQSHSIGAVVRHVVNAQDLTDFRTHEAATADVHGVTGALVGATQTQTLTNKTLTSPTVNGGALSGTFTGTPTFSGAALFTGAPGFRGALVSTAVLTARVTGFANDTFTLSAGGGLDWGGGGSATDTNLYRSAANTLKTDDALVVVGELQPQNLVRATRALVTDSQYETRVSGDSFARWFMTVDGKQNWGPGTSGVDTDLYRSAAGVLKTDGALSVVGSITSAVTTATGVTPAAGWTVTTEIFRETAGVHFAALVLNRSGAALTNPGGSSGNVSPDLQLLTGVPAAWRPGTSVYFTAATGVNSGAARVNTDGSCDLTDWEPGQDIANGANLRLSWTIV